MRILLYNHTALVSGAERVLLMISENVDRDQLELVVACPEGALAEEFRRVAIPVHTLSTLKARFTWRIDQVASYLVSVVSNARAFREIVARTNPDVIHANSVRAGVIASLATFGMPVLILWHVHDVLKRHPFSTAIRMVAAARGAGSAVAVSKATARAFQGSILKVFSSRVPVRVIYNGIEQEKFRPDPDDRSQKRTELGLTDQNFACGIIGQLTPRKGQLELIQAFAQVVKSAPHARLFVAGVPMFNNDALYLDLLRKEVERNGLEAHVHLLGHRKDTPSLLRALDLIVVNSRSEPFSLVLLEALASTTPVLATKVDGIPELITEGQTGFLLRPLDTQQLSERITELIANPALRRAVAEQGRRHAVSHFSTSRFIAQFNSLYASMQALGEKGSPSQVPSASAAVEIPERES